MDGKSIYIVFDDGQDSFNEVIGVFEKRTDAEDYAIAISREWFDDMNIAPEDRIVSTSRQYSTNIFEIYNEGFDVYTYIREYKIGCKAY